MIDKYKDKTAIILLSVDGNKKKIAEFTKTFYKEAGTLLIFNGTNKPIESEYYVNNSKKTTHKSALMNRAVRYVLNETDFEYIFFVDDTIRIKDNIVWSYFIDTAKVTGMWGGSLCYGSMYPDDVKNAREIVDYSDTVSIEAYAPDDTKFMLFHRNIFLKLGFFDEIYNSELHILDYKKRLYWKKVGLPQGLSATISNVDRYIEVIPERVKITGGDMGLFKKKFGHDPFPKNIRVELASGIKELLMRSLNRLEENYAHKDEK
jgi:hypothetical protein